MEDTIITEDAKPKGIRRFIFPIILIGILSFGAWYGFGKWQFSKTHVTTDNAQVDGNLNPVIPRIPGYVTAVYFKENQLVKAGDTLAKLDDRDIKIRIMQAEAAVANAQANVAVVRANIKAASANGKTAKSGIDVANAGIDAQDAGVEAAKIRVWKANEDFKRFSNLLNEGVITQQVFDGIKAEKEASEKQLEIIKKQKEISRKQQQVSVNQSNASSEMVNATSENIAVAEAGVKARMADLELAKLNLSFTYIIAPADGQVSKKNVQVGQFVQPGQSLCTVLNDETLNLWITANFKETQLEKMKEGQKVDIEIDAFKGKTIKGTVQSLSAATGAKFALLPPDNSSGNFVKVVQKVPVRIFLEPSNEKLSLRPGMSAKVIVNLD